LGSGLGDSFSGFYSIQLWKADVEQNQVRLQLFGLLNSFQAVRCFADNSPFRPLLQGGRDEFPKAFGIVYYENVDFRDWRDGAHFHIFAHIAVRDNLRK
jgi:hypothetical protein